MLVVYLYITYLQTNTSQHNHRGQTSCMLIFPILTYLDALFYIKAFFFGSFFILQVKSSVSSQKMLIMPILFFGYMLFMTNYS